MWERDTHCGVAFDNGSIDTLEGVHCREGDAKDTEDGDEAGIYFVPSTSCLSHGSNKTKVLEGFVVKILSPVIDAASVQ